MVDAGNKPVPGLQLNGVINNMRNESGRYSSILLLALPFLLSSCNSLPIMHITPTKGTELHIGDGGFLSGEPCGPPCFWGITPGVTTGEEMIKLIEQNGVDTTKCEHRVRLNPDQSELICGYKDINTGYPLGIAINPSGIVTQIGFHLEKPITLGDVIAKYGDPNAISVVDLNSPPLPKDMGIILYIDSIQAMLGLNDQEEKAVLTADPRITGVNYSIGKYFGIPGNIVFFGMVMASIHLIHHF